MKCELCQSLNEEFRLVKKSKYVFSIICLYPLKQGHLMILPIRHVTEYSDLTKEESKEMMQMIDDMSELLTKKTDEDPIVFINRGEHSSEGHLHMHILPSEKNLRGIFVASEGVEEKVVLSKEKLSEMKNELLSVKSYTENAP